jgi:transcriptional regulator with XRE-family HTH domain
LQHESCSGATIFEHDKFMDFVMWRRHRAMPMKDKRKPTAVSIGRRIKEQRELRELSLDGLSQLTGGILSASRIGNYEQGTREPRTREARILASALGCSAAHLLLLEEDMTKDEIDLLRNYRALPEKDRKDYSRRIAAVATIYREPVADEKLVGWHAPGKQHPQKAHKS